MILQNLVIPSRRNLKLEYSGMDSLERCLNKDHFRSYPHKIEYVHNSRGFRDSEWPDSLDELKDAIWCVGDSFTAGIGSPYEFIWPQVLAAATGRCCINVSMDGASNTWISRRAQQIIKEVAPIHMVVLWSYFHRREHTNTEWPDERRRLHFDKLETDSEDFEDFANCCRQLKNVATSTTIVNGMIPHAWSPPDCSITWQNLRDPVWPSREPHNKSDFFALPEYIQQELFSQPVIKADFELMFAFNEFINRHQIIQLTNLDYARDHHHFDNITSEFFVQKICKALFANGNTS
jgi:hypothetical protein